MQQPYIVDRARLPRIPGDLGLWVRGNEGLGCLLVLRVWIAERERGGLRAICGHAHPYRERPEESRPRRGCAGGEGCEAEESDLCEESLHAHVLRERGRVDGY